MAADNEDIAAVKEWLASEVKLERYADKLLSNGYISLEICCKIDESVLDEIGIVLAYHRKRFLGFVEKLREKLGVNLTNEDNSVIPNTNLIRNGKNEGNEQEQPLISFDSDGESKGPVNSIAIKEDVGNADGTYVNVEDDLPRVPPKMSKRPPSGKGRPPPIPPRRDLEEVTNSGQTDTVAQNSTQQSHSAEVSVPTDVPKKRAPVKPPRRTIKGGTENKPEAMPSAGLQTSSNTCVQQQSGFSVSDDLAVTFDPLKAEETSMALSPSPGSPNLSESSTEGVASKALEEQVSQESGLYGNIEDVTSDSVTPIQQTRPAPKAPARTTPKRPVPAPRTRVKSEDGILVTALMPDKNAAVDEDEESPSVLNHSLQLRTKSFSTPGSIRIIGDEKSSSTLPRYPASKRGPPPLPPSRKLSGSLKDKIAFPNMPLPPVPSMENNKNEQDELDGADPQVEGLLSPDTRTPGPEVEYESLTEPSIYECVGSSRYHKAEESTEVDYSSDESLDGVIDDLQELPEFNTKLSRADSVDSTDESRMSRSNILSPRVRKSDGFLWKQGGQQNNKGWRKRWFVFNGSDLRYYKDKNNLNESLHIIPVSQIKDIEPIKDSKRPTFKVITPNRNFILASESTTEMNLWSQTLMEAIITYKGDDKASKSGGDMCDPDKEGWLKKQGHNVVADWKKRYVAVKDDKICYYDTYEDFVYATPINCINAALAKVKTVEGHKNRFVIITFNKSYSFQGDSEHDASSWIIAIETAIQIGLGDRTILEKVWVNPSNRLCADCGMKDPVWASVNFCVCVCAKCVGIHRNLGVHCSRARSLLMDEKIWNPTLVELMIKIGNDKANQLLEHKLPDDDKISPQADVSGRREFIYSKYWEKRYCKYHQAFGNADVLGKTLRDTVLTDDVLTTMELILNQVDVRYVPSDAEDENTPLELAEEAGQTHQAELLRQNGGEGKFEMQSSNDEQGNSETSQSTPVVYEKEGFLYRKEGAWKKKWFLLKDRHLKYARGPHEKEDLVTIDLATVTQLVKCPKGEPLQMDIATMEKTHSLKADTEEELEAWYSALRSKQVFGVLLSQQDLGSDGIPHLVAKCLQFVETYGGLEMEGVYRVNGGQLTMKKLRTSFDQDAGRVLLTLEECGVHDVTGVLKQYLRELPDPVIPGHMYRMFIAAGTIQDHNPRLLEIKDLVNQLPKVNHDTLKEIIFHLTKVVELVTVNKMGVPNIAMIFGPTLMSNENTGRMDDASINQEFSIIGDMIKYYQWLFDVDEEEVKKDQVIQMAKKKIRELNEEKEKTCSTGGEFTLDIYVKEKNDSPCRLKVSSEMTAGSVCAEIVAKMNLPRNIDWVLFEVIDNGAMERAFQIREKVLAAANWGSDNYLIVKDNYIAEQIAPHEDCLSMEGTLYIREPKKGWKQSNVCLKNGYLSVNKERGLISKATKAEQWPLQKLTLYVGVPAERASKGPDTSCGFTVVVKTDNEEIIRYLCGKDKSDMNRWLAAILNMKHPEGIWSVSSQTDSMATAALAEAKGQQTDDLPMFLGRQSTALRRKGSSKMIMEELRVKQKSLRRSVVKGPRT